MTTSSRRSRSTPASAPCALRIPTRPMLRGAALPARHGPLLHRRVVLGHRRPSSGNPLGRCAFPNALRHSLELLLLSLLHGRAAERLRTSHPCGVPWHDALLFVGTTRRLQRAVPCHNELEMSPLCDVPWHDALGRRHLFSVQCNSVQCNNNPTMMSGMTRHRDVPSSDALVSRPFARNPVIPVVAPLCTTITWTRHATSSCITSSRIQAGEGAYPGLGSVTGSRACTMTRASSSSARLALLNSVPCSRWFLFWPPGTDI